MKLSEKEWEPFFISSLFKDPKRGKRIVSSNHIEGDTPLVSSAGDNNGVTAFIGNREKVRIYENCLSIAMVDHQQESVFMNHLNLLHQIT